MQLVTGDVEERAVSHRILVVDDFHDTAEVTCAVLEMLGHCTRAAYSGHDALAAVDEFGPDIVILDLTLPDLSGYDVARHLRARYGAQLYLAAVTGWSCEEDRDAAYDAGFDIHVVKPTSMADIREILRDVEARRLHRGLS